MHFGTPSNLVQQAATTLPCSLAASAPWRYCWRPAVLTKENRPECCDEPQAMQSALPASSSESRCAADRSQSAAGDLSLARRPTRRSACQTLSPRENYCRKG